MITQTNSLPSTGVNSYKSIFNAILKRQAYKVNKKQRFTTLNQTYSMDRELHTLNQTGIDKIPTGPNTLTEAIESHVLKTALKVNVPKL